MLKWVGNMLNGKIFITNPNDKGLYLKLSFKNDGGYDLDYYMNDEVFRNVGKYTEIKYVGNFIIVLIELGMSLQYEIVEQKIHLLSKSFSLREAGIGTYNTIVFKEQ